MNTKEKIKKFTKEITDLLIEKNTAYGDSATNPKVRVFANHLSLTDSIRSRIDDKLNRIKNLSTKDKTFNEDTLKDLIGYLILLYIAENESSN